MLKSQLLPSWDTTNLLWCYAYEWFSGNVGTFITIHTLALCGFPFTKKEHAALSRTYTTVFAAKLEEKSTQKIDMLPLRTMIWRI